MTKAEREIRMRDTLRIEQNQWLPLWRDCTAFCMPQKQRTVDNAYAQLDYTYRPRFNPMRQSSTAIDSLNVLSGGCKSWLIPGGDEGWGGAWQPEPGLGDPVKDWLQDCTLRSIPILEAGGFFTAGHEMLQDLGCFGTAGMMISEGDDDSNPIVCEAMTCVNFLIQRDWQGNVIRYMATWSKAASWIKNKFSQQGDTLPPEVTRDAENATNSNNVHELLETVYLRRAAGENGGGDYEAKDQPYASCWIHVASKTVMRERGEMEMPFVAPRWNTWAGTNSSAYGTSPAMQAIADCKGLNLMDIITATRAETEVVPRTKVGPSMSGTIDFGPGGITQVPSMDAVEEWGPIKGNYTYAKDFSQTLEMRIKRAFFTPLFEAISPIIAQRELNNYVAEMVRQEAAVLISPAMSRLDKDFFQQAMMRVFWVLKRKGVFEEPPEDAYTYDRAGQRHLWVPRAVQANRMSRTLNARKKMAYQEMMGRLAQQVGMGHPEVLDPVNFEAINADLDRGDGMPKEWKFSEEEVQKMRAEKARIQEQQALQQTLMEATASKPMDMARIATGNIAA